MSRRAIGPLALFLLCVCSLSAWADEGEKKDRLTVEELLKTDAGRLFIERKYAKALPQFQALAQEYPQDIVVKRYVGACYDNLRKDREAIGVFEEILVQDPTDLPSHEFLGKIYLRNGDFDSAEKHFSYLIEHDTAGAYSTTARARLESIRKLRAAPAALDQAGRQITPQDFLQTRAAQEFMNARYENALEELAILEQQYPRDITVKRYTGITLDKLGRFPAAMEAFDKGMALAPDSISLHYFRAQTLAHQRKFEQAAGELRFVIDHDTANAYKPRALADLKAVENVILLLKKVEPKKWTFTGSAGVEYNTNATSESRVTRSTAEEHAFKFSHALGTSYQFMKNDPWTGKLSYNYYDAFYSDTITSLNTISHSFGPNFTHVRTLGGRSFITQIGQSTAYTQVHSKFYSLSSSESLTLIYSFADWHRIILTERFTQAQYKNEGTNHLYTSKVGIGNSLSLTNNFYFNKQKTRYLQAGYEFAVDDPKGSNYVKNAHAARLNYYFPLIKDWTGTLRFRFKASDYPDYTNPPADAASRRDEEYTGGASIAIPIDKHWTFTLSYNYVNNQSKDNTYTYINHAGGGVLAFDF